MVTSYFENEVLLDELMPGELIEDIIDNLKIRHAKLLVCQDFFHADMVEKRITILKKIVDKLTPIV